MSIWLRITEPSVAVGKNAVRLADIGPTLLSATSIEARLTLLNETGDRRFWLSARALVFRAAGRWQRPLAIRDMRRVSTGERRSHVFPNPGRCFRSVDLSSRRDVPSGRGTRSAAFGGFRGFV